MYDLSLLDGATTAAAKNYMNGSIEILRSILRRESCCWWSKKFACALCNIL